MRLESVIQDAKNGFLLSVLFCIFNT